MHFSSMIIQCTKYIQIMENWIYCNIFLKLRYSSLISTVINTLLMQFSLSENNLLSIIKEKQLKMSEKRAKKVKKYLFIYLLYFLLLI